MMMGSSSEEDKYSSSSDTKTGVETEGGPVHELRWALRWLLLTGSVGSISFSASISVPSSSTSSSSPSTTVSARARPLSSITNLTDVLFALLDRANHRVAFSGIDVRLDKR